MTAADDNKSSKQPFRVLVIVAHPNDEFGVAATLRGHTRRGDDVCAAWLAHDDRTDVRDLREAEARHAMSIIDVPPENLRFPDLPSQPLAFQLPEVADAVRALVDEFSPDVIYVPAYEGGHPDHDAVNFAAWEAALPLGVEVREFPLYRAAERTWLRRLPVFGRLLPSIGASDVRELTPRESRFKRTVWGVYKSQRPLTDVLLRVAGDQARFFTTEESRPLPMRDYTKPPHDRPLLYELHPEIPFSFEEFAQNVRRFYWSGGVEDDGQI